MPIGLSWRARDKGSCIVQLTMKLHRPTFPAATMRLDAMLAAVCTIDRITIAKHGCLQDGRPLPRRFQGEGDQRTEHRVNQMEPNLSDRIRRTCLRDMDRKRVSRWRSTATLAGR